MQTTGIRIIVESLEDKSEKRTPGGIIIPEGIKPTGFIKGKVIATGPKVQTIKNGDIVNFQAGNGEPILLGEGGKEKEYIVLKEMEVAVID